MCCIAHIILSVSLSRLNSIIMCLKEKKRKFIDSAVRQFLRYCPMMSADVALFVACQFALESNFGCSRLAVARNNFCGMRVPSVRLSNNISKAGFAKYSSPFACIIDYCYWLSWNHFDADTLFSLEKFSRKLIASKYCPDEDYIDRIYSIFNQFKSI